MNRQIIRIDEEKCNGCGSGSIQLVTTALDFCSSEIPVRKVIVSNQGKILDETWL